MGFLGAIDFGQVLITFAVLLFSLSIHESAHAWMAERRGDPTGRYLGRITLNPIPHIDPIGTILFPLIGLLSGGMVMFGWAKPVPINPNNLKNRRVDDVLIAAAGPASNVIAAIGFFIALKILLIIFLPDIRPDNGVIYPLFELVWAGLTLNVILAVFNLIPIPPLDGSWILAGILPSRFSGIFDAVRPYSFILLVALLMSGAVSAILNPILTVVQILAS